MDFKELALFRRSIRSFTSQPLAEEELRLLLRAALLSPTGKNSRAWQFVVVRDPSTLLTLSHCKAQHGQFVAEAPVAIVVLGNPAVSDTWVEDTSLAALSIQLQAADLGLGSCWCQVRGREQAEQIVRQTLSIPSHLSVECIIAVGHPAASAKPHDEASLKWNQVIEFQP